jgi:diguanylate cyclase (GGDEF)-like protein
MGIRRYRLFNVLPLAKEVIFASIEAGVIIYDLSDRLVDFNPAAGEILNIQQNQIGQPLALALAENPAVIEQLCCGKPVEPDSRGLAIEIKNAGRIHYYRVVKSPIQSLQTPRVIGYVASLYDVTEQERLYQEVRKLATFDPLTNVYNRRVFEELSEKEIAKIIRQHRSLTMIMLDVDQFKHINDTYGHQAGDELLQEVAQVCLSAIRQSDIFGRFGGDEFIFLLPNTPLSEARRVAERVRKSISQLQMANPAGNYSVTASLGVGGAALGDGITFEKLFAAADQAMYRAKQHGGNMACYEMIRTEPRPADPSEAQPAV